MAPANEYTIPGGGGGRLKLKGVQDGRIDKKKKKKRSKDNERALDKSKESSDAKGREDSVDEREAQSEGRSVVDPSADADRAVEDTKTEAERRYEEARRKRLNERLKREGAKTHKERVEELNKYLSKLSEHHDMPRIGPG
ncbi:protein FAM32A [Coccidioides immitis RS]|uniref:Protein FAM32A n=4 Tax=Coccidioides immitis TaxID=5501 RepID=J3K6P7_COCIM|nr:protein FAM32A [Coccidioides immitis RS]KMP02826.1 hypothetical protein CIRG_02518 [Coccidioides immitis RMSCC 2394]KMU77214.1 hypothetical protein CISG_06058 [Coccidioides immitis RMSCC 3703]KMU91547.1 hypothetical protein CIHG_09357 [Coccidioides immitis H538.4]TPX23286.1 hypothetical protein DIZ76_012613 [Coccidioides immitis]EAS30272.3 protein FAM32A [Coccidioides immitis RS]